MLAFVPFGTRLTFGAPVLPVTRVRKNVWAHEALGESMCCGARFRPSGTRFNARLESQSVVGSFAALSLGGTFLGR